MVPFNKILHKRLQWQMLNLDFTSKTTNLPLAVKITVMEWDCYFKWYINTLRLRQNGRHFPDDIFKCIFLNENVWISIKISLNFVPRGPINNIPALVQIMAWRWPDNKPLSEPMMVRLLTHICVPRPQWVKIPDCYASKESQRFIWNFHSEYSWCLSHFPKLF